MSRPYAAAGLSCAAELCAAAAAAAKGAPFAGIRGKTRGKLAVSRARQLAAYLHHTHFGASVSACARVFSRDRATVRHACARLEDSRDDPLFDYALRLLEAALSAQQEMIFFLFSPDANGGLQMSEHDSDDRSTRRLLQMLGQPGAHGALDDLKPGAVVVFSASKGVTLARASLPAAAAERLLAEGLVAWSGEGRARRLRITDAGHAHLRRGEAPPEANRFHAQHAELTMRPPEAGATPTLVNESESPLAWLARRKDKSGRPFLERAHIEAGERFRRDVERAQLLQRVTTKWEAPIGGAQRSADSGAQVSMVAIDARRRLEGAYAAVGPELSGLLTDVCGYLKGLEIVESERGWPARSGKIVLRIALDRLARHYGLASEARGPSRAGATLHWGAEDYRPAL